MVSELVHQTLPSGEETELWDYVYILWCKCSLIMAKRKTTDYICDNCYWLVRLMFKFQLTL